MLDRRLLTIALALIATATLAGPYALSWTGELAEGTTLRILGFFQEEDLGPPGAPGVMTFEATREPAAAKLLSEAPPDPQLRRYPTFYAILGNAPDFAACTDTLHLGRILRDGNDGTVTWRDGAPAGPELTVFLSRTSGPLDQRAWEIATIMVELGELEPQPEAPGQPGRPEVAPIEQ